MDESRITLEALVDAAPDAEIALALAQIEAVLGSGKPLAPNQKNSADGSPDRESSVWRDLLFLLVKMASIALAFVLLFTFLFGIMRYREPSMAPAIRDGDLVIFYRYAKSGYQPQDAVILRFHGKKQARRVIATAGDIVDIAEDGLVVNGALQQELEIYQETQRYQDGVNFPLTVPEGQIFVLGDNRTDATDSRIYGCVKISDTLGKVMTVLRRRGI